MSGGQSIENANANWDNYSQYFPYIGSVVGAVALGAIGVIVAAPVVVPAIVGVVGVGASTALIAGVIGSAVVGAGIGAGVGYVVGEYIKSGEAKKNDSEFQDEVGGDDDLKVGGGEKEEDVQSTGREVGFGPGLFTEDGSGDPRKKMTALPKLTGAGPATSKPSALDPPGECKPAGSEETDGVNRADSSDVSIMLGNEKPGKKNIAPPTKPLEITPLESDQQEREQKIKEHFTSAGESNEKFLRLLDKYREKAIEKILEGEGDFNSKKDRIDKIFEDTDFSFVLSYYGSSLITSDDFSTKKSNIIPQILANIDLKSNIIPQILANLDFAAISDKDHQDLAAIATTSPSNESDAIVRLLIFKHAVNGILGIPDANEVQKKQALKAFITQHSISGSPEYDSTLKAQNEETSKIFTEANFFADYVSNQYDVFEAVADVSKAAIKAGGNRYEVEYARLFAINYVAFAFTGGTDISSDNDFSKTSSFCLSKIESEEVKKAVIDTIKATSNTVRDVVATANASYRTNGPKRPRCVPTRYCSSPSAIDTVFPFGILDSFDIKNMKEQTFSAFIKRECKNLAQVFVKAVNDSVTDPESVTFFHGKTVEDAYKKEMEEKAKIDAAAPAHVAAPAVMAPAAVAATAAAASGTVR